MTGIVPRATIDQIDASRSRCLDLYGRAWDLVREAGGQASVAVPGGVYELPSIRGRDQGYEKTRDECLETVRKPLDRSIWHHLLQATSLDRLMDRKAKDDFRSQVEKDPPPATADNCLATMESLLADSEMIFKRGIANTFAGLDRRFRSHDGFKVGTRIVLTYFAGVDGYVRYGGTRDSLLDVERTFYVLDGKPQPDSAAGIIGALWLAKPPGWSASAYEAETDYVRVKVFKNGNAHVWFKRDDLVERVNLILADWYGAALGASPDVADRKHEANRTPAKNYGFFETPEAVAERVMEAAGIYTGGNSDRTTTILEPSAGRGRLAVMARKRGGHLTCVEIQQQNCAALDALGFTRVHCADFLDQTPDTLGRFDRIVMNPPFDAGRDVDQVTHAIQFLNPGGRLASVMAAGVEYREDRKTADFRALVERFGGSFRDLPAGSFAESGTNVNTVIVSLQTRAAA